MKKKVLIIGSGGREHALGWKLAQSKNVCGVFYSPGNAGTSQENKGKNISIDCSKKENFPSIYNFIKTENIDMVVVGPEIPLNLGIVDYLNAQGYNKVFGPSKNASKLESDKFFSYDLMKTLDIPQAKSVKCKTTQQAIDAIKQNSTKNGIVIKARGLTGGKGVFVCNSEKQAMNEITKHSAKYGPEVLISERLFGEEFSVFAISDGEQVAPIKISFQDHKSQLDGDKGPNTGGMGAYGPANIASCIVKNIAEKIMTPLIQKMKEMGNEYKGFLYAGMMMTKIGPKVIEFNIRFGDPECQPAMMLIKNDLYQLLSYALEKRLDKIKIEFNPGAACCVILASKGYPENYKKGLPISGLDCIKNTNGIKIFHSGTKSDEKNIVTNGGRVLSITSYSEKGIKNAQKLVYQIIPQITIPGGFQYRTDIADKALG